VATVPFFDGITLDWLGAALELELDELLLELLLELELGGGRHGGTISVVTLLLAGSTSWSCAVTPVVVEASAPPGVTRMVLAGGGAIVGLLLELLELELLLLEPGDPQGSIATVWVSVLLGITISFDPGGTVLLPDWETTAASEHEVTAMVSGLCCLGITTVLTPGLIKAAVTGSELELLEDPPPLLPHAASPAAVAQIDRAVR
jgi:hypothetical protein